jgi:hypothetical protein
VGQRKGLVMRGKCGVNVVIDIQDTPKPLCNERRARCSCCLDMHRPQLPKSLLRVTEERSTGKNSFAYFDSFSIALLRL